jgi:hypothetical protein
MNSDIDEQNRIFTRFFLLDEIDANTAARKLAVLPRLNLDGYYYWLAEDWESGKGQTKLAALTEELEKLGIKPPAA